uniref:Uncharacterized protein n=1 Tax=Cannabis sativa TaxID=3483 RepID=A0A803Q7P9_CANSA
MQEVLKSLIQRSLIIHAELLLDITPLQLDWKSSTLGEAFDIQVNCDRCINWLWRFQAGFLDAPVTPSDSTKVPSPEEILYFYSVKANPMRIERFCLVMKFQSIDTVSLRGQRQPPKEVKEAIATHLAVKIKKAAKNDNVLNSDWGLCHPNPLLLILMWGHQVLVLWEERVVGAKVPSLGFSFPMSLPVLGHDYLTKNGALRVEVEQVKTQAASSTQKIQVDWEAKLAVEEKKWDTKYQKMYLDHKAKTEQKFEGTVCSHQEHLSKARGRGIKMKPIITPGVQETGNTSSTTNLGIPRTEVSLATNVQTTVGDDTEIQNLRNALGLMQGHTNTLHHDHEQLCAAVNLSFEEQRRLFTGWRDKEMETLRAQQGAIDD